MNKVYIVSAKRTAIGRFLGTIANISAADLGATVIKSILEETKVDPSKIDEVIVGNVLNAGQRQGVARQAAIKSGIPHEVPAYGINMICGSGMKAVLNGVMAIQAGAENLVIAGGCESMSGAGYVMPATVRNGHKMGNMTIIDHMVCDGLTDAFNNYHMGITAENIATKYGITRAEQDEFALESQKKAIAAIDNGKFKEEIVPVECHIKKEIVQFDMDEFPNRSSNVDKLASLKPAFAKEGTVTAGNASGINDGASFVLLASEAAVKEYGLTPLCEVLAVGQGGVDPAVMGLGPVPAIKKALEHANLKLSDMEIIELNEAFAAQSLGVIKQLTDDHGVTKEWIMQHTNPR